MTLTESIINDVKKKFAEEEEHSQSVLKAELARYPVYDINDELTIREEIAYARGYLEAVRVMKHAVLSALYE